VANWDGFNRLTTSEAVAQRLRDEIQRGVINPGARLRQSVVASHFGVSTTPVREAFALLQSDGLVRIDPHRGAIVFRPSVQDVEESYEIRDTLETLAIKLAVPKFTPEMIEDLQGLVDRMSETTDHDRWVELNKQFHLATYEPSGRPRLCSLIGNLRDAGAAYIYLFVSHHSTQAGLNEEHQAIVDACRDKDVRAATTAVRAHLRHTVEAVAGFLANHRVKTTKEEM
jgi:DNA-binding GntR family transcriptional regulator